MFLCFNHKKMVELEGVESWAKWWAVLKFHHVLNKQDIIDILCKLPSKEREEILLKFQNENTESEWTDKIEEYETLKPAGFEYAPKSAQGKWKEWANTKNLEKMKWSQNNVSYNADGTINILSLKKTFCEDISWQDESFTFAQAQELEKTNAWWYKLMTDYNDTDSDQEKKQTDRYKLINLFSWNNWDTVEGMRLFRDMAWCNNRYWTATPYKDEKWKIVNGVARYRELYGSHCLRSWHYTGNDGRVCGFKDSM